MFSRLLDGIVIDLHLLGEMLLEPLVLLYLVVDEHQGKMPGDLYACLTLLAVVEPCLGPPPYARLVREDAHDARNVKALYLDVEVCKRVNQPSIGYGLLVCFFFTSSLQLERNVPCRKAR